MKNLTSVTDYYIMSLCLGGILTSPFVFCLFIYGLYIMLVENLRYGAFLMLIAFVFSLLIAFFIYVLIGIFIDIQIKIIKYTK